MLKIPVIAKNQADWNRSAANAINNSVQKDSATPYTAPTAGVIYDAAQVQDLMDEVARLSARLNG